MALGLFTQFDNPNGGIQKDYFVLGDFNSELAVSEQYGQGGNPTRPELALYMYAKYKNSQSALIEEISVDNSNPLTADTWTLVNTRDGHIEVSFVGVLLTDPIYAATDWLVQTTDSVKTIAAAEANVYLFNSEDFMIWYRLQERNEAYLAYVNENPGSVNEKQLYIDTLLQLTGVDIHFRNAEYRAAQKIIERIKYSCALV